jgi:hypothetical protein
VENTTVRARALQAAAAILTNKQYHTHDVELVLTSRVNCINSTSCEAAQPIMHGGLPAQMAFTSLEEEAAVVAVVVEEEEAHFQIFKDSFPASCSLPPLIRSPDPERRLSLSPRFSFL